MSPANKLDGIKDIIPILTLKSIVVFSFDMHYEFVTLPLRALSDGLNYINSDFPLDLIFLQVIEVHICK